jgi:predicted transposase YbfD/YdcC
MRKDTSSLVHEPSGEASAGADPLTEEALARRRAELAKIELRAKAAEEKAQRHHEAEQRLAAEIKRHVAFLARIGSAEGEAPEQIEAAETLMAALSDAMIALHGFEHAPIPQAVRRWAMAQQMSGQMADAITAARALLATLTLDGALVTGDAIHAQAETAQLVLDRGGDYLFALKANRPAVQREVAAFFADPPEVLETFTTTDADHGRVETRRHRVTHCVDWLFGDRAEPGARRMPGLATLACVEAERIEGDRTTRATRFYLSSARLTPSASPAPSAPTGPSKTASTGSSTSPSTRTPPAIAPTTARKTSPSSAG